MGYGCRTNFISIPNPIGRSWASELEIYQHLFLNKSARDKIFDLANCARMFSRDCVIVEHPILQFPFFLHATTTDEMFIGLMKEAIRAHSSPILLHFK
jgi:hypothetical protein